MKNFYKILGLADFASVEEIKKAYRSLALQHHPDRGGSVEKMQQLNEAYDYLIKNKEAYDRQLGALGRNQGFTIIVGGWEYYGGTTATASWGFAVNA